MKGLSGLIHPGHPSILKIWVLTMGEMGIIYFIVETTEESEYHAVTVKYLWS